MALIRKIYERTNDKIFELECGHLHTITIPQFVGADQLPQLGGDWQCEYCDLEVGIKPPTKQRSGDQPLPIHNNEPFCHDKVVALIESLWPFETEMVADVRARKALGITRYGRALQPHNGRDFLQDLYEELLDASAYAQGCVAENKLSIKEFVTIIGLAKRVKKLMRLQKARVRVKNERAYAAERHDPDPA